MKIFRDGEGREWQIAIHVAAVRRVKDLLGVDLLSVLDPGSPGLLEKIAADPILLCDLLYVLVKPQADQAGVTDEGFGAALAGDALDRAATAFLEELTDFFPQARRELLGKLLKTLKSVEQKAAALAGAKLEGPAVEALIAHKLSEIGAQVDAKLSAAASAGS